MGENTVAIGRRRVLAFAAAGAAALVTPLTARPNAQDKAPNRRSFALTARNYAFAPDRIDATKDDLVRITIEGRDQAHSFAIDEYRIARRIPPDGTTTVEFRADRTGTFAYYCNISTDPECHKMRGTLVIAPR
jgi:heme/copper-type cytochrome/quinol oxidase subunit 2